VAGRVPRLGSGIIEVKVGPLGSVRLSGLAGEGVRDTALIPDAAVPDVKVLSDHFYSSGCLCQVDHALDVVKVDFVKFCGGVVLVLENLCHVEGLSDHPDLSGDGC